MAAAVNRQASALKTQPVSIAFFLQKLPNDETTFRARVRGLIFEGTWEQCWDFINKRLAELRKDGGVQKELRGG